MSRPITPIYAVPTWATTTNYPVLGQAWDGTAVKDSPLISYWTPGVPPAGQDMNFLMNAQDQCLADAKAAILSLTTQLSQIQAQNWTPANEPVASGVITAICWDPKSARWIASAETDGAGTINSPVASVDGGKTWDRLDGTGAIAITTPIVALCANPSGTIIGVGSYDGANTSTVSFAHGSNIWTTTTSGVAAVNPLVQGAEIRWFNGKFVLVGGRIATGVLVTTVYETADGVTWTHNNTPGSLGANSNWTADGSGFGMACSSTAICAVVNSVDADNNNWMIRSTDGTNWTAVSGIPTLMTGYQSIQMTYDDVSHTFLCTAISTGHNTKIFQSVDDGVTWTLNSTISGHSLSGIATCGTLWVLGGLFAFDGMASGTYRSRAAYSVDAGATWRTCPGYWLHSYGFAYGIGYYMYSNGHQFLGANGANVCPSLTAGLTEVLP